MTNLQFAKTIYASSARGCGSDCFRALQAIGLLALIAGTSWLARAQEAAQPSVQVAAAPNAESANPSATAQQITLEEAISRAQKNEPNFAAAVAANKVAS